MPPKKKQKKRGVDNAVAPEEQLQKQRAKEIKDNEDETKRQLELMEYSLDREESEAHREEIRKRSKTQTSNLRLNLDSLLSQQKLQTAASEEQTLSSLGRQTEASKVIVDGNPQDKDFSMTAVTVGNIRNILKNNLKEYIFRRIKFYNRFKHAQYSTETSTLCGQLLKRSNMNANATWWENMRPMIIKTLTDHRNNCIKRMQKRFKGTTIVSMHCCFIC
jgi:hypothetical protein